MSHTIADVGACTLDDTSKALLCKCYGYELSDEEGDAENFGTLPVFSALGVTAMPYPKTADGNVQAVVATDIPGENGAIVGMRDTRTADIVGNLKPGDTVLHTTGPRRAAQVQLKEDKQIAALVSKSSTGDTIAVTVDGDGDQVQIVTPWGYWELSKANGAVLSSETGEASIQVKGKVVCITGQIVLGGRTTTAPLLSSLTPVVGTSGTAVPVPGVFMGS